MKGYTYENKIIFISVPLSGPQLAQPELPEQTAVWTAAAELRSAAESAAWRQTSLSSYPSSGSALQEPGASASVEEQEQQVEEVEEEDPFSLGDGGSYELYPSNILKHKD